MDLEQLGLKGGLKFTFINKKLVLIISYNKCMIEW